MDYQKITIPTKIQQTNHVLKFVFSVAKRGWHIAVLNTLSISRISRSVDKRFSANLKPLHHKGGLFVSSFSFTYRLVKSTDHLFVDRLEIDLFAMLDLG